MMTKKEEVEEEEDMYYVNIIAHGQRTLNDGKLELPENYEIYNYNSGNCFLNDAPFFYENVDRGNITRAYNKYNEQSEGLYTDNITLHPSDDADHPSVYLIWKNFNPEPARTIIKEPITLLELLKHLNDTTFKKKFKVLIRIYTCGEYKNELAEANYNKRKGPIESLGTPKPRPNLKRQRTDPESLKRSLNRGVLESSKRQKREGGNRWRIARVSKKSKARRKNKLTIRKK